MTTQSPNEQPTPDPLREFEAAVERILGSVLNQFNAAPLRAAAQKYGDARVEAELEAVFGNYVPGTKLYYKDPVKDLRERLATLRKQREASNE